MIRIGYCFFYNAISTCERKFFNRKCTSTLFCNVKKRCIDRTWAYSCDIYFSALSDKDVEEMLKILETLHCPITLVSIDSYRCYPLETLSYPLISKEELIERINHPVTDMLICGSLYFIGEVLEKVDG